MPRQKKLISADDLYRFSLNSGVQISPDGEQVVYCRQRIDQTSQRKYYNLWVVPASGGRPRQFTYGDQVDAQPRWSPDGRAIAFISNRADEKQSQIYIIPFDGGEARPLTDLKGDFGGFEWSPDGKQLVFNFRKTDQAVLDREADSAKEKLGVVDRHITRLFYKQDGEGFLPQERWHIWMANTSTGRAKQLTKGDTYDEFDPHWSPDGGKILFHSNRAADPDRDWDQADLYVISVANNELYQIETAPGPKSHARFSPDGWWIAFYQEGGRTNLWQNINLWVVPTHGNSPAVNLTGAFDLQVGHETLNDIGSMQTIAPAWSADSRTLYFQVTHHGDTQLKSIAVDGTDLQDVVAETGVVDEFHLSRDSGKLAYLFATMTSPGEIMVIDPAAGAARQLTRHHQALLRARDLGAVEEVWFKGPDGNDLQGWILTPPGFDPNQTYPSILEIHGGPMTQYGHFMMHEFYFLAAHGYVVYFCNPRGGLGYGEAHTKAIYNDWGNKDYADLMAWVDVVEQKPYIDRERMGVTGGSYGGFMTTWIIGHTNRFQAAVTQRSVSNSVSMFGSGDLASIWSALFGPTTHFWDDHETYWRQSPLKYIGQVKTPTLVIHSEDDLRCSIEQGEQVFIALKTLGVDTEFVRFPDESHGLSRGGRTDRRIARLNHILRWFDKYLK
ncbi:MAG: S9 family peptidase [Anaerolineales bacterium]|nr:S9 family peptidase [Anaerolineales bacterium]